MDPHQPPRPPARSSISRAAFNQQALTAAEQAPLPAMTLPAFIARHEAFLTYATDVLGHAADTRRNYKGTFATFLRFLATFPPEEAAYHLFDIEGWVAWNRRRGLSPISVNTYWRQLRPFFKDLAKRDGLQDPYQFLRPPTIPALLPKARSVEECRHILASAEHFDWPSTYERWRAVGIIGMLLYAGLRRGEVLRLQFLDVDFASKTIRVNRGKGRGGGKDRVIPIAPELLSLLTRYHAERRRCGYAGPGFFASTQTGQPISLSTFRRIINTVRRASGIPFSVHSLRHSFITMLLSRGVPIHIARDLAGHSSIVTTAGYLRVFDDEKQAQIRKLSYE